MIITSVANSQTVHCYNRCIMYDDGFPKKKTGEELILETISSTVMSRTIESGNERKIKKEANLPA